MNHKADRLLLDLAFILGLLGGGLLGHQEEVSVFFCLCDTDQD